MSKRINLDIFGQLSDVFTLKKSSSGKSFMEKGERQAFFIGSPNDYSVYPKDGSPGDLLLGKLKFINSTKIDGGQYYANLVIPPAPIKPKEATPNKDGEKEGEKEGATNGGSTDKPEKTKEEKSVEELTEAIRDLQISHLKKLPAGSNARADLLKELEDNHPNHLPLFVTKLELLLESGTKSDKDVGEDKSAASKSAASKSVVSKSVAIKSADMTPEVANSVCEAADELLKKIDLTVLAQYYGVKQDTTVNEATEKKKENDEKKKAVISAYRAKAQALAILADATSDSSSVTEEASSTLEPATGSNELAMELEKTWKALAQWLDSNPPVSDFKSLLIYITRERKAKRFGCALKALNKYLGETALNNDTAKDYERALDLKIELFKDSEWNIWETYERKWKLIRIPPGGYAPF